MGISSPDMQSSKNDQNAVNPDLAEERRNLPFNIGKFTELIHGPDHWENQRLVQNLLQAEPDIEDPKTVDFMSREERVDNAWRKAILVMRHVRKLGIQDDVIKLHVIDRNIFQFDKPPYHLHDVMFVPTLINQADDAQLERWMPMVKAMGLIGTYAQTELGHGTNVRNLETTASYDPKTQEFVIHSPTITSIKWWPGNLGKSSNFTIVQAQLWSLGKCHGPHLFLVQLRDLNTHQPMAGITIGDIGPKMEYHAIDNGFLRLDNVRVPRDHMLMRHAKVEPDGSYIAPPHDKVSYAGMLYVRATMIHGLAHNLARTCTIATRYSCVRRQGQIQPGEQEVKLLDYQTQQYKLFPYIASAFAFHFAAWHVMQMYTKISAQIRSGDVEMLPELHALTAGLKAYVSWETIHGMEICRLACGGHGYSLASQLPQYYTMMSSACTYEGDNTVMLLQVARYLVKSQRNPLVSGKISSYLHEQSSSNKSNMDAAVYMQDLCQAYEHMARRQVKLCVTRLDQLAQKGRASHDAWNDCSIQLTKAAKAHVQVFLVKNFHDAIQQVSDPGILSSLQKMCHLYAVFGIVKRPGKFLEDGYITQHQLKYIRDKLHDLLAEIRPMAVGLVDAFGYTDRELHWSVLGRYDGNVYEHLYEWAAGSPLNKKQVLDSYHKYLGPAMKEARAKL